MKIRRFESFNIDNDIDVYNSIINKFEDEGLYVGDGVIFFLT